MMGGIRGNEVGIASRCSSRYNLSMYSLPTFPSVRTRKAPSLDSIVHFLIFSHFHSILLYHHSKRSNPRPIVFKVYFPVAFAYIHFLWSSDLLRVKLVLPSSHWFVFGGQLNMYVSMGSYVLLSNCNVLGLFLS
ncbi:hypothetical protein L211DRAFT_534394 [Terfezia boudieri ATCC MYA-4762]|uniref:Uncharacterized protein n=1 Tax=Terfezia boudieri ATCC MYA-4762 TaxID=1051890 RepID=A0A3N4M053_9PEZI|nr:hypothetical protein L211DRAFT_534394 [Terfezia boudieri ATCC MYA-4762]